MVGPHRAWPGLSWAAPSSPDRLPAPRILQKLEVPIIDASSCNELYRRDAEAGLQPRAIQKDMLCAGFAEGKKDACKVGQAALWGLGTGWW